MGIRVGTQLGAYEITSLLGKGGMGEVYRARDTKLKREVAIKTLPDEFARDADRLSRFQREAEVLASLNHPSIAQIYGLEESDNTRCIVMELVEGPTLADRIARGPIPVEEALDSAKSICEALEAAHEKGVIHRDLKPANVKIAADGRVKVLDFGLAKAMSGTARPTTLSNSPTLLSGNVGGMIVGTAAYMSPEQARGREADQRSDVFAFGCVLYEMLTGRQAFQGEDVSDVLAAVLKTEPDFNHLPARLNPRIREVLRRCLEKNPKLRWHAVADVRVDLLANPTGEIEVPLQPKSRLHARLPWAVAAVFAVIAGLAFWGWLKPTPPAPHPVMRFAMSLPANPNPGWIAFSRDGSRLAFGAGSTRKPIYVRALDQFEWRPLAGTEDAVYPTFSPDGQWIAYMAGALHKKSSAVLSDSARS